MISAARARAMYGDRDTRLLEGRAEKSTLPVLAGACERRVASRWTGALAIGCLVLGLAGWVCNATAGPLRPNRLRVTPDPFGFGTLVLSCVIRNSGSQVVTSDSTRASRFMFRVSDDVTGRSWESAWFLVPALGPRQVVTVTSAIAVVPDPASAPRITQITVMVLIDEGDEVPKTRKRSYYRWRSGQFHSLPEDPARPLAPPLDSTGWDPMPATAFVPPAQAAPVEHEYQRVSWGALRVRYLGEPTASDSTMARPGLAGRPRR